MNTSHQLHTPDLDESDVIAESRDQRNTYATKLLDAALDAVRRVAALDSDAPSAMLDVLDELREIVQLEVEADLVEVSPGSFLPSHEARQLAAIRAADRQRVRATDRREDECCEALTPGCSIDHSADDGDCDTW
jgi:hypothetical protein